MLSISLPAPTASAGPPICIPPAAPSNPAAPISYIFLASTSPVCPVISSLSSLTCPAIFSSPVCVASVAPSKPIMPAALVAVTPAVVATFLTNVSVAPLGNFFNISGIAFVIGSLPNRIALAVNASMYTYANPSPLAASFCSVGISSLYVFLYSSSASLPNCSAPDAYPT